MRSTPMLKGGGTPAAKLRSDMRKSRWSRQLAAALLWHFHLWPGFDTFTVVWTTHSALAGGGDVALEKGSMLT